jgi:hypothetical protein
MIPVFGLLFHLVLAIFGNDNKGEVIFFDKKIDNSLSRRRVDWIRFIKSSILPLLRNNGSWINKRPGFFAPYVKIAIGRNNTEFLVSPLECRKFFVCTVKIFEQK